MNAPDIKTIIETRAEDPALFEQFFGEAPVKAYLKRTEPGVAAAQKVVDEFWSKRLDGNGEQDPIITKALDLFKDKEAPRDLPTSKHIEELRARVNVPVDASADQIIQAALEGKWKRKAIMLTPLAGPMLPWVHFSHTALIRKQPWLGLMIETDTLIQVARNQLAHNFLKTEATWSLWIDGDIIPSYGDPAMFYDVKRCAIPESRIGADWLKVNTMDRLAKHDKSIVGAVYQQRRRAGKICSPLELTRDSKAHPDATHIRKQGPQDKIVPVEWAATGCLLVHRQVYLDIREKRPDLAPKHEEQPFDYFGHKVGQGGEDAAFGILAKECGHQSYLDLGCWVGHVGNFCYMPEQI